MVLVVGIVMGIAMHINRSDPLKLNRLLQLCSANLPVGGFSFSQGLEYAIEREWISCPISTQNWIKLNLTQSIARTDLAILKRLYAALHEQDVERFKFYNQHLIACRESNELRMADLAMGKALVRLLKQLDTLDTSAHLPLLNELEISFVSAFAISAYLFQLDLVTAQSGFCWTYIDNQVAAATKLVPLGQTQSQNLLFSLGEDLQNVIAIANQLEDHEIGGSLPHLAMASAWHETQYTRLFRS